MSNKSDTWNTENATSHRSSKGYAISFIVLSFLALLLNISVNTVMLCNKKLHRRPSNKFLLNLLISDGFVCISLISCTAYLMAAWDDEKLFYENYPLHRTFILIIDGVVCLSVSKFLLITLDRLIAVKWPFFYEDRIHTKQVFIAITVAWVIITFACGIILIILFNALDHRTSRHLPNIAFIIVVIAGFITLLTSSGFVFVEAGKQLRAIEKIFVVLNDTSNKKIKFRKKEFRLVRINIGMILCSFLFWINTVIIRFKQLMKSCISISNTLWQPHI